MTIVDEELGQNVPSNSSKLLSMYEQKEMVCPMCNKHFLGLQALETHISWAHKVKDPKAKVITDAKGGNYNYFLLNYRLKQCILETDIRQTITYFELCIII